MALKTAYCPAFGHLFSLLKSGVIGEIVEVNASVTTLTDENSEKLNSKFLGGSISENVASLYYQSLNFWEQISATSTFIQK